MAILSGRKVVTTNGTRVRLTDTSQYVKVIDITAEPDNTDDITVGSSEVIGALATRVGTPLIPNATKTYYNVDISEIWLDSITNGDGVTWDASY